MHQTPDIIKTVGEILKKPLPKAKEDLEIHIIELEAHRVSLIESTVDLGQILAEKRSQMLIPRDKNITELDRTVMLESDVAILERDYEFLKSLDKLVEQRLMIALKFYE